MIIIICIVFVLVTIISCRPPAKAPEIRAKTWEALEDLQKEGMEVNILLEHVFIVLRQVQSNWSE